MNDKIGWPAAFVALGFLALVGLMFWRATADMANFDKIWLAAGPIVGVVVGAIPGFFFAQNARNDQKNAQHRAEIYAAAVPADQKMDIAEAVRTFR
ncbi:hypothetical protein [Terrabacter sp. Root181]|uniref:hypothetical protein n=1 Tax=Terrabacter sp. Root181 TaxID=1736484 RepID=UPI0006FA1DE9|nr:hypothetical protein [Terrabacter sp. Root181]KRB43022.1 hypothetical protein ASD90_21790 [Terrabacter sp. Root181]